MYYIQTLLEPVEVTVMTRSVGKGRGSWGMGEWRMGKFDGGGDTTKKASSPGDCGGDGTELRAVSGLNAAMSSKLSNRG